MYEFELPVSAVIRDLMHLVNTPNKLEDKVELLRQFEAATVHFLGERYPTISALVPLLGEIKKREEDESDSIAINKALRDHKSRYQKPVAVQ